MAQDPTQHQRAEAVLLAFRREHRPFNAARHILEHSASRDARFQVRRRALWALCMAHSQRDMGGHNASAQRALCAAHIAITCVTCGQHTATAAAAAGAHASASSSKQRCASMLGWAGVLTVC